MQRHTHSCSHRGMPWRSNTRSHVYLQRIHFKMSQKELLTYSSGTSLTTIHEALGSLFSISKKSQNDKVSFKLIVPSYTHRRRRHNPNTYMSTIAVSSNFLLIVNLYLNTQVVCSHTVTPSKLSNIN